MIRKLLSIIAVVALLSGCASDEPFAPVVDNGETALQLLVPDTRMSLATRAESGEADTRADQDYNVAANEASISNLYLVAFYTEGGARKHYFADLGVTAPTKVNSIYSAYTLRLAPADYDIYILANINPGTDLLNILKSKTTDPTLEEKVKKIELNATGSFTPGALPMSYSTTGIKVETGKTKQVTANLKFCVAKVRFTMLYGKSFGKNYYLDMKAENPITVNNLYKKSLAFPTALDKGSDPTNVSNAYVSSRFYEWPSIPGQYFDTDEKLCKYLEEWRGKYNGDNANAEDPLSQLSPITGFNANVAKNTEPEFHYTHQTVAYLPESLDKAEATATTLVVNAKKSKVSDNGATSEDNVFNVIAGEKSGSNYSLARGHFYDIIGYVSPAGDVVYRLLENISWDPATLNVSLAGTVFLDLGTTVIPKISGEAPYYMSYNTNSPAIKFESDLYGSTGIPYFLVSIDPNQENMLQVSINPKCPETSTNVTGKGFWVQTGNLRKRVDVTTADFSEFLTLSPATRTVSVSQIINEPEYPVYFYWATNKKDLKLYIASLTAAIHEDNTSRNALTISFEQQNDEGEWVSIATGLSDQRVRKQQYGEGIELPSSGRIIVTIKDPTNPKYFSTEITMDLKAEATSHVGSVNTSKVANFRIVPIPTKYRVYFKDKNWKDNDNIVKWNNVHVYAYQPLEVYDMVEGRDVAVMEKDRKTDWIEYSFTGKLTFKGWKPYGGEIDPTESGISSVNDWSVPGYLNDYFETNGYGEQKYSFGVWKNGAGAPDDYKANEVKDKYYDNIDLMPGWRTQFDKDGDNVIGEMVCAACYAQEPSINTLWPGVAMKKSKIHQDWWYVDLPLLAKPGKTYLMFIDVKSDKHGECNRRFPDSDVPGVILPNYPDKEAWYLCDKNNITGEGAGYQQWTNEFTDDKPE